MKEGLLCRKVLCHRGLFNQAAKLDTSGREEPHLAKRALVRKEVPFFLLPEPVTQSVPLRVRIPAALPGQITVCLATQPTIPVESSLKLLVLPMSQAVRDGVSGSFWRGWSHAIGVLGIKFDWWRPHGVRKQRSE
jgi:hypothetical protein